MHLRPWSSLANSRSLSFSSLVLSARTHSQLVVLRHVAVGAAAALGRRVAVGTSLSRAAGSGVVGARGVGATRVGGVGLGLGLLDELAHLRLDGVELGRNGRREEGGDG